VPVVVAPEAPPATPAEVVPVDQRYEPIPEPEVEQAAAAPARARPAREKKSWREQRWERRRRRIWFEETLAWFLVPVILVAGYFFVTGVLSALGTSLPAILNGLGAITSNL
jgi:hypothetical protein